MNVKEDLESFRSTLKDRGIHPERIEAAIASIGQAIEASLPALMKARNAAYKEHGLPTPGLTEGVAKPKELPAFKTTKEGWRNLIDWVNPVNGVKDAGNMENEALNMYSVAPLLTPMDLKLLHSGDIMVGLDSHEKNTQKKFVSIPSVLKKLAEVDIVEQMGGQEIPKDAVPVNDNVLGYTKLLSPSNEFDAYFAHTDLEIVSAMQFLHPEYKLMAHKNHLWIANPEKGIGLSCSDISHAWTHGKFEINVDNEIVLPKVAEKTFAKPEVVTEKARGFDISM